MKTDTSITTTNYGYLRVAASLQVGLALFRLVFEQGKWPSLSMSIAIGLMIIFSAKEEVNDERVELLKLKAAKTGLLSGTLVIAFVYVVTLPWAAAFLRRGQGPRTPEIVPLSAFDALILIMVITLGCYYYWRWQDGRAMEKAD